MNSHEIRIELARLGWSTEDRLSDIGWGRAEYGYSAWVERWNWHGVRLGNKVCLGSHVKPGLLTPETIDIAWRRCHELAVEAWARFPKSLPRQDGNSVEEDETLTKIMCDVHHGNPWISAELTGNG